MNPPPVGRQVHLPLSQAAGIAYKNIRLRLGRSLLVTSGIVLAIAFLMSIQTTDAIADGMRRVDCAGTAGLSRRRRSSSRRPMRARGLPTDRRRRRRRARGSRRAWLLGLALLVAFVGILNAMLMSVTERFREIGTMKCLGALDGFIVKLFLIESLFQGVVGTVDRRARSAWR